MQTRRTSHKSAVLFWDFGGRFRHSGSLHVSAPMEGRVRSAATTQKDLSGVVS